jgi:ADP-ribosylglycohydrolase
LWLLQSIDKREGFDRDGWAADWQAHIDTYDGYFDAATKQTIRHLRAGDPVDIAGSDSTELAGATRLAAVIHYYWDDDEQMLRAAREQTDVTHHTSIIVEAAEFIVHAVRAIKNGMKPLAALDAAAQHEYSELPTAEWIAKGVALAGTDSTTAMGELGRACDVRFSFPGVAQLTARYEDDLRGALIANVEAGGDSAARGLMLGLILGAYHGMAAIPREWIDALSARDAIAAFTDRTVVVAD